MSIGGRIAADFLLAAAPGFLVGLADGLHVFHGAYFELGSFSRHLIPSHRLPAARSHSPSSVWHDD